MEKIFRHRTHPFYKGMKFFGYAIFGAVAAAFFGFIFGYFVMLLWNWLMPLLFSLPIITFWQAVGIVVLARLLFGGFKHSGPPSLSDRKSHKRKMFFNHCMENRKDYKTKNWKYFDDYWCDEGGKSYDDYVDRKEEQEQK